MTDFDTNEQPCLEGAALGPSGAGQLSLFGEKLPVAPSGSPVPPPKISPNRKRGQRRAVAQGWPDPTRFPFNDPVSGTAVGDIVLRELRASRQPLIITGFTSLPMLIELFAHYQQAPHETHLRLLIGHEPILTRQTTYRVPTTQSFSREMEEYWLGRGISMRQSAEVLAAIAFLESATVTIRISSQPHHPIHAKIYRADFAITIGSSNLSRNGMRTQFEANRRHEAMEREAFREAESLAEQLWEQGQDYKANLINLLNRLLSAVTWQEALARGCAEILDGLWARRYVLADTTSQETLWPAQEQGLAQAMWLVDQVGSVLVADATGSGKTRLGAEIMRSMVNRLWSRGYIRNHIPVIVAPPRVLESWEQATLSLNLAVEGYSHALLSTSNTRNQLRHSVLQRGAGACDRRGPQLPEYKL